MRPALAARTELPVPRCAQGVFRLNVQTDMEAEPCARPGSQGYTPSSKLLCALQQSKNCVPCEQCWLGGVK